MTEPISGAALSVTAAGGITVLGIATGLDPALLFAGACGGYWALSYLNPMSLVARLHHLAVSSAVAAWSAPPAVAWMCGAGLISERQELVWSYVSALVLGLVAVPVLGKAIMRLARRKLAPAEDAK